jgi:AraC-like DNA-binding protein
MAEASEPSEPISLRIERGADLAGKPRIDSLPALLLPFESSVVELSMEGSAAQRIDRASFALVPARVRYRVLAVSPVTNLLTLLIGQTARTRTCREYRPHVEAAQLDLVLGAPRLFSRTRWVDELANRYVFERHVCEKHTSAAARFLETEITKELFFLGKEALADKTRASVVHEGSDVVRRAREWIEDHLFSPLPIEELARRCHTSPSSLLRAFRKELGIAPATYVRDRRLDESLLLLQSGRHSVGEVATRVGYQNVSAFTAAFSRRFKSTPSTARPAAGGAERLPPQGTAAKKTKRRNRRSL